MNRKTRIIFIILCLVITFMDISGLPGVLFPVSFADVSPYIIPLMFNFILIGIIAFIVIKAFKINFDFGFSKNGLSDGLKSFLLPGLFATILSFLAFYIGLSPFDYKPTIWKILIEGILYYIGVAIVEEFYVRGLFLNVLESWLDKRKNKTLIAIIISSLVFGLGHIPGMLGMGASVIVFKLISTVGMGFYFGTCYKKTKNIWVPVIMHALIDISALPYCFTQNMRYESITLGILLVTYSLLTLYCIFTLVKDFRE